MRRLLLLISVLPFVAILALAAWMFTLQRETADLRARVEQTEQAQATAAQQAAEAVPAPAEPAVIPEGPDTRAQVEAETRRLDSLRATLAEIEEAAKKQPPTGSIDAYINRTSQRISELEGRLSGLGQEAQAVDQNAQAYQQQQTAAHGEQQLNLENQVQNLDSQILEAQARLRLTQSQPPSLENANMIKELNGQIGALRASRDQLNSQIRSIGTASATTQATVAQQALNEKAEVRFEREDLQRQVADLRADLNFWRTQKTPKARQAYQSRVNELNSEIRAQEERVNSLQTPPQPTQPAESTTPPPSEEQ